VVVESSLFEHPAQTLGVPRVWRKFLMLQLLGCAAFLYPT